MFSDMDLPDESFSLPFDDFGNVDSEDFSLDLGLQSMLDDPNIDLCSFGLLDDVLPKPIGDTSDSDSGISNHGDKLHPFYDIEQGSAHLSGSNALQDAQLSPTPTINTIIDDDTTIFMALSPKLKRPRPPEPLITASCNSSAVHPPTTASISAFPRGATLVKPEPHDYTSAVRQNPTTNHVPAKIPRILSRGQHTNSRTIVPPMCDGLGNYNTASSGEQKDLHGSLVPAIVSLPVVDEFTFSNSFQMISSPIESESFEKLVKKQERMIKNRQAACLSRLRKKEYLERLEYKLDQLRQENAHLRQENNEWRHRYDHLERCLGGLKAEFTSVWRPPETDVGRVEQLPASPPTLSSTFSRHHSSPPQPQLSAINKIPLLRRQNAERIVTQKSGSACGLLGGSRVLGGVGLPRGVRKKVTTSLFAVVCLIFLNISITPLGGSWATFGYEDVLMKPRVGGRTLFSISSMQESIQPSKNQTIPTAHVGDGIHSTDDTVSNGNAIERCLPGSFLDSDDDVVWIVFDENNKGPDVPTSKRQKRLPDNQQSQITPEPLPNWRSNKARQLGRFQRRKPREIYLVQTSQGRNNGSGDWNDEDLTHPLCLIGQSTSSNLTIFLQNKPPTPHLPPGGANATSKSLRFCKLQVRISSLRDLRRRQ